MRIHLGKELILKNKECYSCGNSETILKGSIYNGNFYCYICRKICDTCSSVIQRTYNVCEGECGIYWCVPCGTILHREIGEWYCVNCRGQNLIEEEVLEDFIDF